MLNPFPIQFLAMFAYFILRFVVGVIVLHLGFSHYRHRHELKDILKLSWWPWGKLSIAILVSVEIIVGSMLILGAYTQIAALVLLLMSLEFLITRNWFDHPSIPPKIFYLLLVAISLSLFITGAGVFAFDLPI